MHPFRIFDGIFCFLHFSAWKYGGNMYIIFVWKIFYGKEIINDGDLTIPHKYLHLRAFTLVPLLELIPDFEHPVIHKTISELHNDLENPEMVFLYGTRVDI